METSPAPLDALPSRPPIAAAEATPLWAVHLEVIGHLWWPTWEGYAADSIEATREAYRWFYGAAYGQQAVHERLPLRVKSVVQVGRV